MSIVVNTNIASMMVQRSLTLTNNSLSKSMQKLSTGFRINTGGDDAAGLAMSEKLKSNINSSDVAKLNAQTGINMLQVAESDLAIIQESLQRMRDLAVQSANGIYSTSERRMLNDEFQDRMSEIDRVAKSSKFSDLNLLDGSIAEMKLQIGPDNTSSSTIDISSAFTSVSAGSLGQNYVNPQTGITNLKDLSISQASISRTAMDVLDKAINDISQKRSLYGSTINRLTSTVTRIEVRKENLTSSNSVIRDTDIAVETANMTKSQVLQQSSVALLKQANNSTSIALTLLQ